MMQIARSTLPVLLALVALRSQGIAQTAGLEMKFVEIPAGEFLMGSPGTEKDRIGRETQHPVRITRPFLLGVHEITKGEFAEFVKATDYRTEAERDGTGGSGWDDMAKRLEVRDRRFSWKTTGFPYEDKHPVVNVTWNDAVAFCNWRSRVETLQEYYQIAGAEITVQGGSGYRLPTEAEWEYACRAKTQTAFSFGDDAEGLAAVGNVADGDFQAHFPKWKGIAARDGYVFTAPVGRFRPNAWGLYDMHGNVSEWCGDWLGDYPSGVAEDPSGPSRGNIRVTRGGSWIVSSVGCRSACRSALPPAVHRHSGLGFRVARFSPVARE